VFKARKRAIRQVRWGSYFGSIPKAWKYHAGRLV